MQASGREHRRCLVCRPAAVVGCAPLFAINISINKYIYNRAEIRIIKDSGVTAEVVRMDLSYSEKKEPVLLISSVRCLADVSIPIVSLVLLEIEKRKEKKKIEPSLVRSRRLGALSNFHLHLNTLS